VPLDQAKVYLGLSPEGCSLKPLDCPHTPLADLQYLQGVLQTQNNDYGFARIDHQFNANNNFALRYNIEDARDLGELIGETEDGGGIGTRAGRAIFLSATKRWWARELGAQAESGQQRGLYSGPAAITTFPEPPASRISTSSTT